MFVHYYVPVNLVANFLLDSYHNQAAIQLRYSVQSDVKSVLVACCLLHNSLTISNKSYLCGCLFWNVPEIGNQNLTCLVSYCCKGFLSGGIVNVKNLIAL